MLTDDGYKNETERGRELINERIRLEMELEKLKIEQKGGNIISCERKMELYEKNDKFRKSFDKFAEEVKANKSNVSKDVKKEIQDKDSNA